MSHCLTVSEFSTRRLVSSARLQCLVQSIIRLSMVLINQISSGIQNPENTYLKHTMIANDQKVELLPRFKAPEGSHTFPWSQFSPTSWLMSTLQRHQKNDCSANCETMEHRKDFSRLRSMGKKFEKWRRHPSACKAQALSSFSPPRWLVHWWTT